jgi:hypothetical protein
LIGAFSQLSVVMGAMYIMAAETCNAAPVHYALHEIVSLHAVLVPGAIGIVRKGCLPQSVLFKLPKIPQV